MQYMVLIFIHPVTPQTERAGRWPPPPPQQIKTTFQDLINALWSIRVSAPPPIILCVFIHRRSQPCKMAHEKVKTERPNVKMGHSTLAAYLMHISLLSTCWRQFSHNCLQLKVNTQKQSSTALYIYIYIRIYIYKPRNAMPPVWAWTQKALFTCFFCLFSTVLYCNCVKLKYAPCCVISSLCPNDLICEKTTGPGVKSKRSVDLSLVRFFEWSL